MRGSFIDPFFTLPWYVPQNLPVLGTRKVQGTLLVGEDNILRSELRHGQNHCTDTCCMGEGGGVGVVRAGVVSSGLYAFISGCK